MVWGDFDADLERMRLGLRGVPAGTPLMDALRRAIVDFNAIAPDQIPAHRRRMEFILRVPALQAHSTLRYAAWRAKEREVPAERVERRHLNRRVWGSWRPRSSLG